MPSFQTQGEPSDHCRLCCRFLGQVVLSKKIFLPVQQCFLHSKYKVKEKLEYEAFIVQRIREGFIH